MVRLILFILFYLFANEAYFGGDLLYALGFLNIWYYLIIIPIVLMIFIQLLFYFKIITNPNSIEITNTEIPKQKVFNNIFYALNKGVKTLFLILFILLFQLFLTKYLIATVSPTAVSLMALSFKTQISLSILMGINVYYFVKGIKSFLK